MIANVGIGTGGGDITLKSTVLGESSSFETVNAAWERRDSLAREADGKHGGVGVTTGHSGETDDESSEVMFHVSAFHDGFDDVLGGVNSADRHALEQVK